MGGLGAQTAARADRRRRSIVAASVVLLALAATGVGLLVARSDRASPTPTHSSTGAPVARTTPLLVGLALGDTLWHATPARLNATLDDAVALGVTSVRVDLAWDRVEHDGARDPRWAPADRIVAAANARHLSVLPVLGYSPAWARDPGCRTRTCPPRDPAAFAAFAEAAARRYTARGVHTWEIWNEPNSEAFFRPDPDRYPRTFLAAAASIRTVDPQAQVVVGGLDATGVDPGSFVDQLCRDGGCAVASAIGVHPYTYPRLPGDAATPATAWSRLVSARGSLRRTLTDDGFAHLPVWITSYGAPTAGPGNAADGTAKTMWPFPTDHVTEAYQATLAREAVRAAEAAPRAGALYWFSGQDSEAPRPAAHFGLLRADGTRKPAWASFAAAVRSAAK